MPGPLRGGARKGLYLHMRMMNPVEKVEDGEDVGQFFWSDEERVEFISDVSEHPAQRRRWAERSPRRVAPRMTVPRKGSGKRGGRGAYAAGRREPTPQEIYEQVRKEARGRWSGYGGARGGTGSTAHIVRGVAPTGKDTMSATASWEKGTGNRALRAGGVMFILLALMVLYVFIVKGGLL